MLGSLWIAMQFFKAYQQQFTGLTSWLDQGLTHLVIIKRAHLLSDLYVMTHDLAQMNT